VHDTKKASAGRAARAETKVAGKHPALPVGAAAQTDSLFPYSLLHLGGDEVSYTCWEQSPEVSIVICSSCFVCLRMYPLMMS